MRTATILSNNFPTVDSNAIGVYDLGSSDDHQT